nr:uncharacterized protein LOC117445424 isoform X1 [Pseudochaenichthys georgianus]
MKKCQELAHQTIKPFLRSSSVSDILCQWIQVLQHCLSFRYFVPMDSGFAALLESPIDTSNPSHRLSFIHSFRVAEVSSSIRGSLFTVFGESFPTTMAGEPEKAWSSALLDCFEDTNTCCYGFWCGPCLACTVSGRFGENYCFPLCDIVPLCTSAIIGLPICVPPAVLSTRAAMRNRYHIKVRYDACEVYTNDVCYISHDKFNQSEALSSIQLNMLLFFGSLQGSLCNDVAVSCFCQWCSWCQMHRELKYRNIIPVVINMQHQTVVQMQNQNIPQMQNQYLPQMQNQYLPQMQPVFVTTAQPQPVGSVSPPAYNYSP